MFDQDVFTNLRKVIKLLEKHDLEEIEIEQGDTALRVRRAGAAPVVSIQSPGVLPAAPAAGTAAKLKASNASNAAVAGFVMIALPGTGPARDRIRRRRV